MRGWCAMPQMPSNPSTANHTSITGPKSLPTAAVPRRCIKNKPVRRTTRDRNNVGVKKRRRHFQALHRAQHRDGGGNDAVAVKQRGADQARRHDPQVSLMRRVGPAQHQRGQRQQPALAAVVGPHDDEDVFDHDDQHQGPYDERERAEDGVLAHIAEIDQRLPDGVERGSADIAEYDAERGECQARTGAQLESAPSCGRV